MHTRIGDGVIQIDTLLGGWDRMTAGYLVEGDAPVLVETGSQSSIAVLLGALDELGLGPEDLAGVAVTHIHLDHAGGVGDVAKAFPSATVYVHEKGARHLVDPTRLVRSAGMVYGDLLDSLYGRLEPTAPERIHVLEDGEDIVVSPTRVLTTVDSPGHAKHHLALHDSHERHLVRRVTPLACGCPTPACCVLQRLRPTSTSILAITSLHKFVDRNPAEVALAHYGLVPDPIDTLHEAEGILRQWAEVAEEAFREGRDIAEALDVAFSGALAGTDPANREKLETLNGVHSNAAGFRRWLEQRQGHEHPHPH